MPKQNIVEGGEGKQTCVRKEITFRNFSHEISNIFPNF